MILLSSKRIPRGLTLLEVLLGSFIFAAAMLPLLLLTQSSSKGTYSITKHMIGSQLCSSILDRLLAMPFEDAVKVISETVKQGKVKVQDSSPINLVMDAKFKTLIDSLPKPQKGVSISDELDKHLQSYNYSIKMTPSSTDEKTEMVLIRVTVTWIDKAAGSETTGQLYREAVKYNEDS